MAINAEDQIIHYLKDKVGLAAADKLVAELKREQARADLTHPVIRGALR
ncbi:hypothetical protein [Streptomyces noursei]|nr:hypothetical protein [Streptomyces noursei]MCZ1019808.1 hypothetical protein [Streptomyces noursei]GGX36491.1 hypothetical protein GCM10010341_67580 [Streptomyces noursei]